MSTLRCLWAPFLCAATLWAGFSESEKALKKALAAKDANGVIAASEQLVALGTPEAIKAVIRYGLACDNYKAEKAIAGKLAALPLQLRTVVHEFARTIDHHQIRVILAAVLAAYDDPASFAALGAMVKDPVPPVALEATRHLVNGSLATGDMRAIDALIEGLARHEKLEQSAVVAADIRQGLYALTGEELESSAEWKKWWEPRRRTFKPADAKSNQERPRRTVVRARSFFGHEIVSKRILFILDMSGSMTKKDFPAGTGGGAGGEGEAKGRTVVKGKKKEKSPSEKEAEEKELERKRENLPLDRQRLHRTQVELKKTIESLTPDTRFTVMAFNHEIKLLSESPQYAAPAFKRKAKDFVDGFKPEGETWTDTAVEKAFGLKDQIDTIYLLSDGAPQRKGKMLPTDEIAQTVKEKNRFLKIKIYTVGFQQGGSKMHEFLGALARDSGGTYKRLD